ncbi:hypothetical protein K2X33_06720 [bacterium]|nr:hypothetical protein [bacterium]
MNKRLGIWVLSGLISTGLFAADTVPENKQEIKQRNRWSIADWLETRDKMRMQDLWLAMHSPSPYEFYVGALYKTGRLDSGGGYQGWDFTAAGYAYMFGVEAQYQSSNTDTRWLAMGCFRLFGYHNQATNLTVQGGIRNELRGGVSSWNPLLGANFTLYIAKPAGALLLYRHVFARSAGGLAAPTDRFEAGGFIDFQFVRLHVDYFLEATAGDPSRSFQGLQAGTRVYF